MASHNLKKLAYMLVGALVLVCNLAEIGATLSVTGVCHAGFATCKNGRSCQTSLYTDVDNCGHCGVKCPTAPHSLRKCEKGRCDICCNDKEWRNCDGRTTNGCETNVDVNLHHCGKCGNVCTAPQNATATCSRGICGFQCAKGFQQSQKNCSLELHINTVGSCGSTGQVCPIRPNSDATCSGARTCGFTCHAGFENCDGNSANGCETDLRIDGANCGACNSTCSASQSCSNTACVCNPGFANCDGNPNNGCETDIKNDNANCGLCSRVCTSPPNSDAWCSNGTCGFTCHAGFDSCDGNSANGCETDLRLDGSNCGACNSTCSASQSCSNSACVCNPGFAICDSNPLNGCETDIKNDRANCGTCGGVCTSPPNSDASCSNGTCGFTCHAGFDNCDGNSDNGCETDLRLDGSNCGACNSTCSAWQSCSNSACVCNPGFANCDSNPLNGCETNTVSDSANCGACNTTCSSGTCNASTCTSSSPSCPPGFADCDGNPSNGCETDVWADLNNCGACNTTCDAVTDREAGNNVCSDGVCSVECNSFQDANCDGIISNGCETYIGDINNCNKCGYSCFRPHVHGVSCKDTWKGSITGVGSDTWNSTLAYNCDGFTCDDGWQNCDGDWSNGCETNTANDSANCGACNTTCSSGTCNASTCTFPSPSCPPGFADCDGNPSNGCETDVWADLNNCGACNRRCDALTPLEGDKYNVCKDGVCLWDP